MQGNHRLTTNCILFIQCHIDAAYRFYKTKCEEDSIKRRGKTAEKQKKKRIHERLTRVSTVKFDFHFQFININFVYRNLPKGKEHWSQFSFHVKMIRSYGRRC